MKTGLLMLILIAIAAFRAAADPPAPCSDKESQQLRQTANQDVLFFEGMVLPSTHVRVYDENGRRLRAFSVASADVKGNTVRPQLREQAFYPRKFYIATTASTGCVRGEARRPASGGCVAWFQLPPSNPGMALDRIVVSAPPEMGLDATLTLPTESNVQCTTTYPNLGPAGMIHHVIEGEQVVLTVRGTTKKDDPYAVHYRVNIMKLHSIGNDSPVAAKLIDPLMKISKSDRGGLSLTEAGLLAAKIEKGIVVSK